MSANAARILDSIDIGFEYACRGDESQAADFVLDTSQQVERCPWKGRGKGFKTLTQSSELFIYAKDRLAHPIEHLNVLGFLTHPDSSFELDMSCVTDHQIRSMAGEAMAMPTLSVVMLSLIYAMEKAGQDACGGSASSS